MTKQYKYRHAARGLIYAQDQDAVLLIHTLIPDTDTLIWLAPGGGIEPDETGPQGLYREVHEETGRHLDGAQGPIWHRRQKFHLHGQAYDQYEEFYWLPTHHFEPDNSHNPAASEKDIFRGFRWWTLADMQAAKDEIFVPLTFAEHFANIIQVGLPEQSIDVGR